MPTHPITSGSDISLSVFLPSLFPLLIPSPSFPLLFSALLYFLLFCSLTCSLHSSHGVLPSSILIVGAGVFGLSTALALTTRPEFKSTSITVLDRSPAPGVFPSRDASSIDTSRIIRADYADPAYAALAAEAQELWRSPSSDLGADGRYNEKGLMVVAEDGKSGLKYVRSSWANVKSLASTDLSKIEELPSPEAIRATYGTGGSTGSWGYINRMSGWADAEACMDWLYRQVEITGRVTFVNGTAESLLHSMHDNAQVIGVKLSDGQQQLADLTILATGAWTPSLISLSGRAVATGQVLAYMDITPEEQARLANVPTLLNMSTGYFIITPAKGTLKVARHAYGYLNPTISLQNGQPFSSPVTHLTHPNTTLVPHAEQLAMRQALREMIPWPNLADRPFKSTRLCWYTDTPDGDFIIDYHPDFKGLFVATGGSGHGFKFLPVIGDKITDCVLGRRPDAFKGKWDFTKHSEKALAWHRVVTEDGSRGGVPGLLLAEEMDKPPITIKEHL